jgi:hypothetical protein
MHGLLFRTYLKTRGAMPQKNKGLLFIFIFFVLGIVTVVFVLVGINQPKYSQSITTEPASTREMQVVYPAPMRSQADQSAMSQGVYPPPSNETILPTNTAPPLKISTAAITENNLSGDYIQRTSQEDAKTAFDGNQAVFLDVRNTVSYNVGHIPGAISIPEIEIPERLNELDPSQWIITYCS